MYLQVELESNCTYKTDSQKVTCYRQTYDVMSLKKFKFSCTKFLVCTSNGSVLSALTLGGTSLLKSVIKVSALTAEPFDVQTKNLVQLNLFSVTSHHPSVCFSELPCLTLRGVSLIELVTVNFCLSVRSPRGPR